MYLKRLDIKGFKTFADSTEIQLNPGINIIVGPNGCGKSNIVDAVRWVLGEINVRHLRGQKGEDVIFHGSDRKKSQGMAFVELTLDNMLKKLPLDFNEITLGRKIFRDGESEFYLNKLKVRMKDINSLFTGTGVGRKGYSIISQGELEQVLSGHSIDRRMMLEEASGIIRYRQQRDEVKQRIQNTAQDILRLNDILSELRQRRDDLGRKAEKAVLFKDMSVRLESNERELLQAEIAGLQARLAPQRRQCNEEQSNLALLNGDIINRESTLRQEEEELQEVMQAYKEARDLQQESENQLASLETEIRLAEERINNCRERQASARLDQDKYQEMTANLNCDLEERQNDFDHLELGYRNRWQEIKDLERDINQGETALDGDRSQMEALKASVFEKVQSESLLRNNMNKLEDALRRAGERKDKMLSAASDIQERLRQASDTWDQLLKQKVDLESILSRQNSCLEALEAERKAKAALVLKLNEEYRSLEEEASRVHSRLVVMQDMDRDMAGYSQAARQLVQAGRSSELSGILGLIGEIIKVPSGLELAVETAIGRGVENIVVEKADQAREAIEWLKKKRQGRLTFLPLDILRVQKVPHSVRKNWAGQPGVLGLASELVEYADRYEKALDYLLGRVLLVEDLDQAVRLFKGLDYPLRIVSREGESINLAGAISGGTRAVRDNSPLMRKGEEKKLLAQEEENTKARDKNRKECSQQSGLLDELEQKTLELKGQCVESRMQLEVIGRQVESTKNQQVNLEKERMHALQTAGDLDREMNSLGLNLQSLHSDIQVVHEESQATSSTLEQMREKIEKSQREHEVRKERLNSFREQLNMKHKELETARNNIEQFRQVRDSYQQSAQQSADLMQSLQEEINLEGQRRGEMENQMDEAARRLQDISQELQVLEEQDKGRRSRLNRMRRELGPLKLDMAEREVLLRELEMAVARAETELEGARRRWWERFRSEPPSFTEDHALDIDLIERELLIQELKDEIEALGPVDLESIQEYADVSERYEFLNNQFNDLSEGREALQALLKETEKLMDKDFTSFFALANQSFNQTFTEIFGGGEASLHMDGNQQLETGVNIQVKIPGKKVQGLNLLSGGEKALTCIAFIFSLLRLKPVPFCILDEIDASLDDSNLIKFTEFVKTMAGEIQFIIITHRQSTIEAGERIYGITMPENGISSVLTLNLKEAAELAV